MKPRYIYEYRVRLLSDKAVYYGKLYVDVYSTVLKFSITYDGWEYPYIIDSLPLPKKILWINIVSLNLYLNLYLEDMN